VADSNPSDPCGRCGCRRDGHNPPKSFTRSKFRVHAPSLKSNDTFYVKALNSCECKHCICFCIGFIEPLEGQPYARCIYEAEDYSHLTPTVQNSETVSRLVSSLQSGVYVDKGNTGTLSPAFIDLPKQKPANRKERRASLKASREKNT
jgi:hypothetical protein